MAMPGHHRVHALLLAGGPRHTPQPSLLWGKADVSARMPAMSEQYRTMQRVPLQAANADSTRLSPDNVTGTNSEANMLIAKFFDAKGQAVFAEVVKVGPVLFDDRAGWVLLAAPLNVKPHKRNRFWVEPGFRFEWVRQLSRGEGDHD